MPVIKVQTSVNSVDQTQVESLLKDLSSSLAKHLGKPESYVMTSFASEIPMTFAGTFEPVCYIEIKSIGAMNPVQTQGMSADFCQKINQYLGVATNRIYIEFNDAKGYLWGWNGQTFG